MENRLQFKDPTLAQRIRGMLGVDFYRLFHTPLYNIFIAIAAIIPALILATSGMEDPDGTLAAPLYTNVWNAIAADTPMYVFNDIGGYANMNMVFIFGGIMVSIFIGHDYGSGYVKQLFTTHAKKQDYMISKTLSCAFAMASMCVSYLIGAVGAGIAVGMDFSVNVGSLVLAVCAKIVMSLGWASLYTFLNVLFRRYFGVSIAASFFFGTGILVIALAALVGNSGVLNIFLYGSSVYTCLGADVGSLGVCALCSAAWAVLYNLLGTKLLESSDVY